MVSGDGTERFPYGRVYEREEINGALESDTPYEVVPSTDEIGHGTFLAGVAAGGENRREGFSGVAPLAGLVVVKCKQAKNSYRRYYGVPQEAQAFQENDIMAGVIHILEVAEREQKPVVICMGLGSNMGGHNGGTSLSVLLERCMTAEGTAVVSCVGNEGNAAHHHAIQAREDVAGINVEEDMDGFMIQLWWRTPGRLTLSVTSPRGEMAEGIRAVPEERYEYRFTPENTLVSMYFGTATDRTREQVVVLRFQNVRAGIWKIGIQSEFDDPGYDMWLPIRSFLTSPVTFLEPDPDITLCNPSTGDYTIAVSAYAPAENSLYLQAGRGFTPEGRIKPEVVAPGVNIVGVFPKNRYGIMSGTGVAAAFCAGIGALFFQQYREEAINGVQIREIFIRGAVPTGRPYPNTEWGDCGISVS